VIIPKGLKVRRLHKALLRYHDAENWPLLRDALRRMGRRDLIGSGKHQLVPTFQPAGTGLKPEGARKPSKYQSFRTQHTGLPPSPVVRDRKAPAAKAKRPARATKSR
jgi:hypothetical protein